MKKSGSNYIVWSSSAHVAKCRSSEKGTQWLSDPTRPDNWLRARKETAKAQILWNIQEESSLQDTLDHSHSIASVALHRQPLLGSY